MTEAASVRLDRWQVLDFAPGTGSAADAEGWMPIPAPGDVYQALIAAGRLPHPFQDRNETAAAWVRDREWWQRTTFIAPTVDADHSAEFVFEGLGHNYFVGEAERANAEVDRFIQEVERTR